MKRLIISTMMIFICSCSASTPYVAYQSSGSSKPEGCNIDVYIDGPELPRKTIVLGEMQIRDVGFNTNCGADVALKEFKSKACSIGADAIQLFNVRLPSITGSKCYQAGARFLMYTDVANN